MLSIIYVACNFIYGVILKNTQFFYFDLFKNKKLPTNICKYVLHFILRTKTYTFRQKHLRGSLILMFVDIISLASVLYSFQQILGLEQSI